MPYKILMIAPTPFFADRGCHVRIYEEARSLQKLGHKVTILTYGIGRNMNGLDIRRIAKIPWYRKLEAGPSWHKFYLDELLYWKARHLLKQEPHNVIHAHLHEGVFIAGRLKKRFGLPIIADFQGSMTDEIRSHGFAGNHPWVMKIFTTAERKINQTPDRIITSSKKTADLFEKKFNIPSQKIRTVGDGVDTDRFSSENPHRDFTRKKMGFGPDHLVIAFLGLLTPYQGMDLLIKIIPKVIQKNPNVRFLIMGFPNEGHYQNICRENGIASSVIFTGRIPYLEAADYLAAADIAVSPKISKTEANGKLANYMAMGLPTVAFDTEVNREILGSCGLYAAYPDPEDFARQLIKILENLDARAGLRAQLRERAQRLFSWQERSRQIVEIYDEVKQLHPTGEF